MGPLLWKDNYTLYYPGNPDNALVPDYYVSDMKLDDSSEEAPLDAKVSGANVPEVEDATKPEEENPIPKSETKVGDAPVDQKRQEELKVVDSLPWAHPKRIWAMIKLIMTFGITREVIAHQSRGLDEVHKHAPVFDNRVEYLWTTAQICSAMVSLFCVHVHSVISTC
jgi:PiT family inorganic phosphate transporter/sodium-dependent phosphate transporter